MKKITGIKNLGILGLTAMLCAAAQAQNTNLAFLPGHLVVLRAGDGFTDLAGKQAPIFVDQYDTNGNNNGTGPSLTVAIPTNGVPSWPSTNCPLFFNGQAATEGNMTRSADRTKITWSGYAAPVNNFGGTPSGLGIDRGLCTIDAFTNYNVPYEGQNWFGGLTSGKTNPRGIATDGTNNFWGSGGTFGVKYFDGIDDPSQIEPLASTRDMRILNGKLYTSINAGDAGVNGGHYYPAGVYSFTDFYNNPVNLPTAFAGLKLEIQAQAPYTAIVSFEINPQGTIAYVADTGVAGTDPGGIQKYTKSGGAWQFAYNFTIPQNIPANLNNLTGCYGLAVDWSGSAPVIYATTTEGYGSNVNSNRVVSIVDTGSSSAVTTIAQSPSVQKVFRGIALTPDLRPVITSEPVSYSGVIGSNATFSVSASSVYALGYQWYSNNVPLTSANEFTGVGGSSLIINNAQGQDATSYFVVVTNVYGAVTSTPASLSLSITNVPPALSTGEQFLTNVIGDNVTITVPAIGTDPKTYQWYTNGVALSDVNEFTGSASASLSIANAQINDATTYSCAITNLAGGQVFTVAQLTLIYNPPGIISQPVSTTALLNSPASFTVLGFGGSLTYQWYGVTNWVVSTTNISYVLTGLTVSPVTNITYVTNGITAAVANAGDITGAGTATLNFSGAQFVDTNVSYFVVITNVGGAITSSVVTLSVLQQAAPSVVNYTGIQQIYLQNFDSLPIPSATTVNTANPATITVVTNLSNAKTAAYTYSLGLTNYDFAAPIVPVGNVSGLGLSAMSGWYGWAGIGNKLGASAGDQSTGGQISEGAAYNTPVTFSMTNRALGLLATGSTGPTAFGVKIINNSGVTLSNFCVHYLAELWRQQPSQQPINVGYYVDAVGTNSVMTAPVDGNGNLITDTVNWVPGLTAAFATGQFTALDGTQPTNQMSMDAYNLPVTNWAPNTALWFVFCMTNDTGSHQGLAVDNFTFAANTNLFTASTGPVVTNLSSSVVANGATLYGSVCPNGLQTAYYFQYGTTSSSYTSFTTTNLMAAGPFTNAVTATISGLAAGVTNYYQLVASNSVGVVTNTGVFSYTTPSAPSVTISAATKVTQLTATLNGSVNPSNAATTYYFNWGVNTNIQTTPTVILSGTNTPVNFAIKAGAGLNPNTTYYYDLVAYNGVGLAVTSSVSSFITSNTAAPVVATLPASGITGTNATGSGSVNQGGLVASYWFLYGPTTSYGNSTVTNTLTANATLITNNFAMTGLTPNTTNNYQAWASTTAGTVSGGNVAFTTLALAPTNVQTLAATGITGQGAVFNAQINPNGVTNAYWFQYGTTLSYGSVSTTNYTPASTSTLLFTNLNLGMAALTPNTTYHYQVIDVNNNGSTNGGDMTFTTLSVTAPTVTTLAASNITVSAGTLDASVNANNGATAYWFKYGTNSTTSFTNLTATNSLAAGSGLSTVTNNIGALLPGTIYYFAAVATNSAGTSLGVTNSFTTLVPVPTVVTLLASNITGSAGTLDASVNPNNAATVYWFVYGTNTTTGFTNFTATNSLAASYNASTVTNLLTGLLPVTTYYFSTLATNSAGKSVGVTNSFTTLPGAPAHLAFGQQPTTTAAGVAISPAVTVIVQDAYGNTVTSDTSSVSIVSLNTSFTADSTLSVNAVAGVATFSNLKPTTAGSGKTLGTIDTSEVPIYVFSSPFTVGAGSPNQLAITTQPAAPAVNGGALATQPVVAIEDSYGNVVSTATSNIVAHVGAGTWTLNGPNPKAAVTGTAAFTGLTATSASAVTGATISFTSSPLTGVTSTAFNIPAPIASSLGGVKLIGGQFVFTFTNTPGLTISVLSTNDLTVPRSSWPVVGTAVEGPAGTYNYTNSSPTSGQQYYLTQP